MLVMRLQTLDAATFAHAFGSLLSYPGWAMATVEVNVYHRALAILESHPRRLCLVERLPSSQDGGDLVAIVEELTQRHCFPIAAQCRHSGIDHLQR